MIATLTLQWLSVGFRVHQIRFRPGLRPGPRWGAYSASTDLLAAFRGAGLFLRGSDYSRHGSGPPGKSLPVNLEFPSRNFDNRLLVL